jgi:hypothetical protein
MQKQDQDLILAAARLARSSPREWESFLGEFEKTVGHDKDKLLQSPADRLQQAQGYAQSTLRMYTVLKNAVSAADKMQGKNR